MINVIVRKASFSLTASFKKQKVSSKGMQPYITSHTFIVVINVMIVGKTLVNMNNGVMVNTKCSTFYASFH